MLGHRPKSKALRLAVLTLMPIMAAILSGCQKSVVSGQTIVMGHDFEVTLSELDQVLRAAPPVRKEQVGPARLALLQALIAQKLLAEAGQEAGLGKRPEVVQQIAAAQRSILANAYVRSLEGQAAKPTAGEITRYYNDHPAVFKNRVEFTLQEYRMPIASADIERYADILNSRGFGALTDDLALSQPQLHPVGVTLSSGGLPSSTREGALGLHVGSDVAYSTSDTLHLGHVTAVRPTPVGFAAARDQIADLILQERKAQLVGEMVDHLKQTRKVQIVNAKLAEGKTS